MSAAPITRFEPDAEKLGAIRACLENYDLGDPEAEWPNNIISRRAVVYGSGVIARQGAPVRHAVDPVELSLCRRLAEEAADMTAGVEVGMGSEASDSFSAFFIAGNVGEAVPQLIDEHLVRSKFGGTIFPLATITVEPLSDAGVWWSEVTYDGSESGEHYLRPWRAMIRWFREQPAFADTAFIRIGDRRALWDVEAKKDELPEGTEITGCVLPRLALGLTEHGSLVGLFGYTVQT
jgi:hypothetical protein